MDHHCSPFLEPSWQSRWALCHLSPVATCKNNGTSLQVKFSNVANLGVDYISDWPKVSSAGQAMSHFGNQYKKSVANFELIYQICWMRAYLADFAFLAIWRNGIFAKCSPWKYLLSTNLQVWRGNQILRDGETEIILIERYLFHQYIPNQFLLFVIFLCLFKKPIEWMIQGKIYWHTQLLEVSVCYAGSGSSSQGCL